MTNSDKEIRRRVLASVADLEVAPAEALRNVLHETRHRRLRSRWVTVVVATAAVLILAAGSWIVFGSNDTPGPTHTPHRILQNPLRITREFSASSLGLVRPRSVSMAADGQIYVTDTASQTITELSSEGTVVRRWGGPGTGPGEFRMNDGGIAVGPMGRVYVADSGNARVQVFSRTGRYLNQIGGFGNGPGKFQWPWAIAVGADGSVYVSDDLRATLTKLSPDGHQQWRIGGAGSPADLIGHEHFGALDSEGRLVTANDDSGKVIYVSADGREVASFGTGESGSQEDSLSHPAATDFPGGACDTSVDSNDEVFVASCSLTKDHQRLIQVFDPIHRLISQWAHAPLQTAPRFGPDGQATAISSTGGILVLHLRN